MIIFQTNKRVFVSIRTNSTKEGVWDKKNWDILEIGPKTLLKRGALAVMEKRLWHST